MLTLTILVLGQYLLRLCFLDTIDQPEVENQLVDKLTGCDDQADDEATRNRWRARFRDLLFIYQADTASRLLQIAFFLIGLAVFVLASFLLRPQLEILCGDWFMWDFSLTYIVGMFVIGRILIVYLGRPNDQRSHEKLKSLLTSTEGFEYEKILLALREVDSMAYRRFRWLTFHADHRGPRQRSPFLIHNKNLTAIKVRYTMEEELQQFMSSKNFRYNLSLVSNNSAWWNP